MKDKIAGEQSIEIRLSADDLANAMLSICTMPESVVVEEMIGGSTRK